MRKRTYILTAMIALSLTTTLIAHPGRVDAKGGHKDGKNVSGLGSYHFHCGDNPPHLHQDGTCPYGSNTPQNIMNTQNKQAKKGINVIVNGINLAEAHAIQLDGRTIVALRPICDALGVSLDWDTSTQTATGQKGDSTFVLAIGNKIAKVNDQSITLDVAGQVIDGKTLVPVRFIAESLGAVVDFDSSINAVVITTNN